MQIDLLQLKNLSGYLPHGIKVFSKNSLLERVIVPQYRGNIREISITDVVRRPEIYKLMLRPLSYLTKEIEHNGDRFVTTEIIRLYGIHTMGCTNNDMDVLLHYLHNWEDKRKAPYWVFEILYMLHFDIHGLIESGLAVDINTSSK